MLYFHLTRTLAPAAFREMAHPKSGMLCEFEIYHLLNN